MKKRTALALGLNILIVVLTVIAVIGMMTGTVSDGYQTLNRPGPAVLKYFTVDSNLLAALSAAVTAIMLFRVITGKRSTVPGWADMLRLSAVASVSLTALFVAFCLAPEAAEGFSSLYQGPNRLFHLVIPLLAIAELLLRRSEQELSFRANFLSLLPAGAYGLCYIAPFFSEEAPAGRDWYHLLGEGSSEEIAVLFLLVILISFSLSVFFWCITRNFDRVTVLAAKRREEKQEPGYASISAHEYYQTRVIKLICAIAPAVALCAAVILTALTLTDRFDMSPSGLILFDACCLGYLPVALYISDTCIGANGVALESKVRSAKRLLTVLIAMQWNLISYLAPFGEFWAYAFLFAAVSALFLDRRMLLINEGLLFGSMLLSWAVRGDVLLPAAGESFMTSILLRLVAVLLSFMLLYILVLFIEKILLKSLDRISDFDPLTHTLTRRKLLRAVEDALDTYNRIWVPCCIAIFDLDDFKRINDTYGHMTGDEVLKEFARILYANIQSHDIVFRYGGEEFLILFFCTGNYAEASCTRILHELRNYEFDFLPAGEHITCTAGISVSARDMTADDFIALADKRLYAGKRAGKDRVVTE